VEITDELIDKLARLARLHVPDSERESLRADLQRMIGFVDRLREVDTTGVEPLTHLIDEGNVLRPDRVGGQLSAEETFLNAPEQSAHYFTVPKVVDKS
jgi:aspartyl-tRNA(Asn)/glutamyl-tRNA(Gln) amidotransferase subunit C